MTRRRSSPPSAWSGDGDAARLPSAWRPLRMTRPIDCPSATVDSPDQLRLECSVERARRTPLRMGFIRKNARQSYGLPVDYLVVDSTGLSIVGEGEWTAAKHGGRGPRYGRLLRGCGRSWRERRSSAEQDGTRVSTETAVERSGSHHHGDKDDRPAPVEEGAGAQPSDAVPILAAAGEVSRAGPGRRWADTAREPRPGTPSACRRPETASQHRVAPPGGSRTDLA